MTADTSGMLQVKHEYLLFDNWLNHQSDRLATALNCIRPPPPPPLNHCLHNSSAIQLNLFRSNLCPFSTDADSAASKQDHLCFTL